MKLDLTKVKVYDISGRQLLFVEESNPIDEDIDMSDKVIVNVKKGQMIHNIIGQRLYDSSKVLSLLPIARDIYEGKEVDLVGDNLAEFKRLILEEDFLIPAVKLGVSELFN